MTGDATNARFAGVTYETAALEALRSQTSKLAVVVEFGPLGPGTLLVRDRYLATKA